MALAVDVTSPAAIVGATAGITTAAFNPPACVLVACVVADPTATMTISNNGAALTWTEARFRNGTDGTYSCVAGVWVAVLSAARTGMTVTATSSIADDHGLKVYVVTGADLVDPIGASAEGSSAANAFDTTAFTTESAGSLGFVVGDDFTAVSPGPSSSDTTFTVLANGTQMTGGSGYKTLGAAGSSATFNLDAAGTAGSNWNWVAVEIKASAPVAVDAVSPARVTATNGVCTTAAFTAPEGSVLVACMGGDETVDYGWTMSTNGAALTWTKAADRGPAGANGNTEVWWARLPTERVGLTVTSTFAVSNDASMKVYVITGALPSPIGAVATGVGTTTPFTTTAINTLGAASLGVLASNDYAPTGQPTVSPTSTVDGYSVAGQISGASAYRTLGAAGAAESFTLTYPAAPMATWAVVEILSASVTLPPEETRNSSAMSMMRGH